MNPEIDEFGTKAWYNDAEELHREDGPALEFNYGTNYWYFNGELHRSDGPAVNFSNGVKYWYIHGERIFCQDNEEFFRIVKMKEFL
jgi:hypothetical protein